MMTVCARVEQIDHLTPQLIPTLKWGSDGRWTDHRMQPCTSHTSPRAQSNSDRQCIWRVGLNPSNITSQFRILSFSQSSVFGQAFSSNPLIEISLITNGTLPSPQLLSLSHIYSKFAPVRRSIWRENTSPLSPSTTMDRPGRLCYPVHAPQTAGRGHPEALSSWPRGGRWSRVTL